MKKLDGHPNTINAIDLFIEQNSRIYLVMDLFEGQELYQEIK